MKLKLFVRTTAVVAVALVAGLMASPALADVWTDQYVYQAGDMVSISGNGMQAGESVGVDVLFPDASLAQHHDVLADDQGTFSDTYTLAADAPSGDYTVVSTGAESGTTFTTTFDPIGAGALNCPLPIHNPTHYKLQVGTTVTCTIDGASEVSGQATTSVWIKSSTLGDTELTGTVTGTGDDTQITFTFKAPADGCDTTVVAYDSVGTNANNSVITPGGHSAAGLAYVDGTGNVIECGGGGTAHVTILKVADESSVTAGESIGFTITVSSDGTATAEGVQVSDTLPTDAGTSWSINGGTGAGDCGISLGVLTCNFGDMAASFGLTVHITSGTTKATANDSPVVNTASVSSTNAGSGESTDQVDVICPRVALVVRADKATVHAGASAGFMVSVTRKIAGRTYGIAVASSLPNGLSWLIDGGTGAGMCSLAGTSLTCNFGDMDQGTSYSVHVSAVTSRTGTMTDKATVTGVSPLVFSTAKASISVI